jgi:hypothetical protein
MNWNFLSTFLMTSALTFSFGSVAFATGGEIGNGGDIVLCQDKTNPLHMRMLDYYEAERRGRHIQLPTGNSEFDIARKVLQKLAVHSPERARGYLVWLNEFEKHMQLVTEPLMDIQDAGPVLVPDECYIKQFGIQITPGRVPAYLSYLKVKSDTQLLVSQSLWQDASIKSRAGLLLHELFLREALLRHHETSAHARYFNGEVVSSEFLNFSEKEVQMAVFKSGFGMVEQMGRVFYMRVDGLPSSSGPKLYAFHLDAVASGLVPSLGKTIPWDDMEISISRDPIVIPPGTQVLPFFAGDVAGLFLQDDQRFGMSFTVNKDLDLIAIKAPELKYKFANGRTLVMRGSGKRSSSGDVAPGAYVDTIQKVIDPSWFYLNEDEGLLDRSGKNLIPETIRNRGTIKVSCGHTEDTLPNGYTLKNNKFEGPNSFKNNNGNKMRFNATGDQIGESKKEWITGWEFTGDGQVCYDLAEIPSSGYYSREKGDYDTFYCLKRPTRQVCR